MKTFTSGDELKAILAEEDTSPLVVGYFDESTNSADKDIFEELSNADGYDYRFAMTTSKSALEELKFDGCAVVVYKPPKFLNAKLEKPKARYPSKNLKKESLQKFYQDKTLPLVAEKTYTSSGRYRNTKLPLVYVFADLDLKKNWKGYQYLANRISKVAKEYTGKAVFALANKADEKWTFSDYGLPDLEGKRDVGVGLKIGDMHYAMKDTTFSADKLKAFMADYFGNKLVGKEKVTPDYSKPAATEEEDNGPSEVVTLTTDNFQSEVMDGDADTLVEFYAPWYVHATHL
jgi:hypothetical protein